MKVTVIMIGIILVLIFLSIRYHLNEKEAGLPAGTVKICSTSNLNDCHYVDEKIVNAVYAEALSIANADESETFPVEAVDDFDVAYSFSQSDLNIMDDAVAAELNIPMRADCSDGFESVQALTLHLHKCLQTK